MIFGTDMAISLKNSSKPENLHSPNPHPNPTLHSLHMSS